MKELEKSIRQNYSIEFMSMDHYHTGSNTTYLLKGPLNRYFLKEYTLLYGQRNAVFETNTLRQLKNYKFSPDLILTNKGDSYLELNNKIYFITKGIVGSNTNMYSIDLYKLGIFIKNFHSCKLISTSNNKQFYKSNRIDNYFNFFSNLKNIEEFNKLAKGLFNLKQRDILDVIKSIQYLDEIELPICYTHSDITPYNIISKNNEIVGIVDFEYSCYRERLYDLAWAAVTFIRGNESLAFNNEKVSEIIYGYGIDNLSDNELYLFKDYVKLSLVSAIHWSFDNLINKGIDTSRFLKYNINSIKLINQNINSFTEAFTIECLLVK